MATNEFTNAKALQDKIADLEKQLSDLKTSLGTKLNKTSGVYLTTDTWAHTPNDNGNGITSSYIHRTGYPYAISGGQIILNGINANHTLISFTGSADHYTISMDYVDTSIELIDSDGNKYKVIGAKE